MVYFPAAEIRTAIAQQKTPVKQSFAFDDEDYLLAVRAGDLDAAQEMVDEAAQETGYTIRAYHGTAQEFNVFNGGAFFRRLS